MPTWPKITLKLGHLQVEFATASELRDALLASFCDAEFACGPFIVLTLDDARPAWEWTVDLVNQRSDWRPALGIALQHAVHDGGDLARTGLADLLANYRDSVVLLEWTAPLAQRWPDVRSTKANTGWGGGRPEARLADIVADQQKYWASSINANRHVVLDAFTAKSALAENCRDATELESLLAKTAKAGRFPDGDKGPWSWLTSELLFRAWLPAAVPQVVSKLASGAGVELFALLDWFSEEWDLWRFVDLLDGWQKVPPPWWSQSAMQRPSGWKYSIRSAHWPGVKTLGDVALEALKRAHEQAATPPVVDLPVRN